jgi:Rrf2 family protein
MLSLTKRTSYGLIALSHLARSGERPSSAREIAERYSVPAALLTNVLKSLAKGELVRSVRGAKGGYRLAMPASEMTLAMLITAIEGPVQLVECASHRVSDDPNALSCRLERSCPVRGAARKVDAKLRAVLEEITLADMLAPGSDGESQQDGFPSRQQAGAVEVPRP